MKSYSPELAHDSDLLALWRKVRTQEDTEWTRRYHTPDPREKAFGGRVVINFNDGSTLADEIAVADAHPLGARPFTRPDYIRKFRTLTEDMLSTKEADCFLSAVERLPKLRTEELAELNLVLPPEKLACSTRDRRGIF